MESCLCHCGGPPLAGLPPPPLAHCPPPAWYITWWMVGALGLYADKAFVFVIGSDFLFPAKFNQTKSRYFPCLLLIKKLCGYLYPLPLLPSEWNLHNWLTNTCIMCLVFFICFSRPVCLLNRSTYHACRLIHYIQVILLVHCERCWTYFIVKRLEAQYSFP